MSLLPQRVEKEAAMAATSRAVPGRYHTVTPYLTVNNVAALIEFVKAAFGATEVECLRSADGSIRHAEVKIGDSIVMMGEAGAEWKPTPASLYVYVTNVDETYARALGAGAVSLREPANQFYGDRSGGVRDVCGNQWWMATRVEDVSEEEMVRRFKEAVRS
jgi:PhnB protein